VTERPRWRAASPSCRVGLDRGLRRSGLLSAALFATLLAGPLQAGASAAQSRDWRLECGELPACVFTLELRGRIDASRIPAIEQALRRRTAVGHALDRRVDLHVDVDSRGGEVFAALEIGRLLRRERASISVGRDASCISACVFLLMGAVDRSIERGAHLAIHRPSLGDAGRSGLVDEMAAGIALYADEMNVPRAFVDDIMSMPAGTLKVLKRADLARYGIPSR
jgi:hypothetical protein